MKLSVKIPLTLAVTVLLLLLGGLFGIYRLNTSTNEFGHEVLGDIAADEKRGEITGHLSAAVHEWENVLLHGKEQASREKYWSAHLQHMADLNTETQKLAQMPMIVEQPDIKALIDQFSAAITVAQSGYKQAYDIYVASGGDTDKSDAAAQGLDNAAAQALAKMGEALGNEKRGGTQAALDNSSATTWIAVTVMLIAAGLAAVGAVWLTRQIVVPLASAVDVANRVAAGDLSQTVQASSADEWGN